MINISVGKYQFVCVCLRNDRKPLSKNIIWGESHETLSVILMATTLPR